MHLTYITRVNVGSNAAQARQILFMSRAFHRQLGSRFLLIASGDLPNKNREFKFVSIFSMSQRLRYIGTTVFAAIYSLFRREHIIYTRDIVVAAVVVLLGGRSVFEAHKEPKGYASSLVFKALSGCSRFKIVCISNALGEFYRKAYSFSSLLVAHDGVFPEDYNDLRSQPKALLKTQLELPLDRKVIVHTGSLYKGGAELFFHVVFGRLNVEFVHVGGTEEECESWMTYYQSRGVSNIRFIPHKSVETVRIYQVAADLLFYVTTKNNPIYWCTSPLKLFEYMATGNPILGAAIGSVNEIINENNAYCFDPDDIESIEKAYINFERDEFHAVEISNHALRDSIEKYSWHIRANSIVNFLTP